MAPGRVRPHHGARTQPLAPPLARAAAAGASALAGAGGAFSVTVGGIAVGDYVTATAMDALGNTSEFALNLRAVAGASSPPVGVYLALLRR